MKKLTLSAEPEIIDLAKRIADENGTTVSQLFARFVHALARNQKKRPSIGPKTRRATGLIKLPADKSDDELLTEALLDKYGLTK